ncbi:MAG TPA: Rieske 2Fe-2S domain-containing protein [Acidimicrobiales bacterium]|nr:Rieske 2Fe-2S domain-containing protein [Acidimicrobiales bacterium]
MSQRTRPVGANRRPSTASRSGRRRRHVRYDAPPPRALALSGWALVPLRSFLGVTFTFAGLQKLANPNFFNANSPSSIQAQLIASIRISPLHELLGHLLRFAAPIGVMIALAELAVGLGTILGLWTRVAAVGGMVLALTLFLTVSFHSSPYYTGADIVFVFAWIPLILAGSGGVLSLDGVIAARAAHEHDLGPPAMVPVRFALVQQVCGHFENESCTAKSGRLCDIRDCPFLIADSEGRGTTVLERGLDGVDRRTIVLGGAAAAAVVVAAGTAAGLGRAVGGAKSPKSDNVSLAPPRPGASAASGSGTTTTTAPSSPSTTAPSSLPPSTTVPAGTPIGLASQVPVGGAASFSDPKTGDPGLILQLARGRFVAYDAVCPHAGCTVAYSSSANLIVCPCHGSEFDPNTGAVVSPPAPHGLSTIKVAVDANGELVVES